MAQFKATDCNNVSSCSASGTFIIKNADQIEQFLFCRFLILPRFPAVLTCDIPAGVLHPMSRSGDSSYIMLRVIHTVALCLHQCCRSDAVRLILDCILLPFTLPAAPPYFFPIRGCAAKRSSGRSIGFPDRNFFYFTLYLIHACFIFLFALLIPYTAAILPFPRSNTVSLAKTAVPY